MVMTARWLIERLAMQDRCQLGAATADTTDYAPTETYTWGETLRCAVIPKRTGESEDGANTPTALAEILLPLGADIDTTARVRVTHRAGRELPTPVLYEVVGSDEGAAVVGLLVRRLG